MALRHPSLWRLWLAALLLWTAGLAWGADLAPVPPLKALATDTTGTLTPEQLAALDQRLRAYEAQRGTQVAVLLVPTTQPEAIEQYSLRVVEQWKLGRKKVDDGVLLVLAKNDRTLRIEVGYGLEGVLNDATSKRIIEEAIVPRLRNSDFDGALRDGADRIMQVASGEALPEPVKGLPNAELDWPGYAPVLLIATLVLSGILRSMFGRFFGAAASGGAVGLIAWWVSSLLPVALVGGVLAFLFTLLGSSGRGGRGGGLGGLGGGGWGHGGGGGFGGGGGGFGGGGGGGFGGGGASGRW